MVSSSHKGVFLSVLLIPGIISTTQFAYGSSLYFKNAVLDPQNLNTLAHDKRFQTPTSNEAGSVHMIQFEGISVEALSKEMESAATLLRYIPDDGFLVQVKNHASELNRLEHVVWHAPYHAYLKMSKALVKASKEETRFVVQLFLFEDLSNTVLEKLGAIVLEKSRRFLKLEISGAELLKVAALSQVEWMDLYREPVMHIEKPAYPVSSNLLLKKDFEQFQGYATGAKVLNAQGLYARGITGASEVITIADSGLDVGEIQELHADVQGRVVGAYAVGRPEIGKWDDPLGHGTHVVGLAVGNGTKSNGHVRGVAYEARMIIQSLFKWATTLGHVIKSMGLPADVDRLFEGPYADGSRIHTNSWGSELPNGEYDIQSAFLDYFVWQYPDFVVLFAAGNFGVDLDQDGVIDRSSLASPATAKNCITVGASENYILTDGLQMKWLDMGISGDGLSLWPAEPIASDFISNNVSQVAAFSSRGPTQDGRLKPDVVAPGTNNLSLRSRVPEVNPEESWGVFNEDYVFMGGTSMATPLVAGAVALVRQYYQEVEDRKFVSSALVKATLINGADDLSGESVRKPNSDQGFGRVNLEESLLPTQKVRRSFDETMGVKHGEEKVYSLKVMASDQKLRVTLAYHDYPGSPAVRKALVNDLDLSIETPSGEVFYPNGLNAPDTKNNVEQIELTVPRSGVYTVHVRGKAIRVGTDTYHAQPYALVATGKFSSE
ncbi:MAG: S8 family serine peptidase [Deltaproteobacteria bacterium]|nr:S8 family serine peptidase [Deltaproteobacteria bacterium]